MLYAPTAPTSTYDAGQVGAVPSSAAMPFDETKELADLRRIAGSQDPYLFSMRAAAYTSVLFVHSLQNFAYHTTLGKPVDFRDYGPDRPYVISNVLLPAVLSLQSLLMARNPKRDVYMATDDVSADLNAQYVDTLIEWAADHHRVEQVMKDAAVMFSETGNVFFFVGWDPAAGRMVPTPDGSVRFEGDAVIRADSMFAWALHPQARDYRTSPLAHHVGMVSREWVRDSFPEVLDGLPTHSPTGSVHHGITIERSLTNLSSTHGTAWHTPAAHDLPEGDEFVEWHTCYYRSSSKYRNGKMVMGPGVGGYPVRIAHVGENPYIDWSNGQRTLPIVHLPDITVPMRALGESRILHAIPQQVYINEARGQVKANADLLGNPQLTYEQDGIADAAITNEVGGHIPRAQGSPPPEYIRPPGAPDWILEGEQQAFRILDLLFQPVGPGANETAANVRSAVHQMVIEEQKQQHLSTTIRAWEQAVEDVWQLYTWNVRTFWTWPRKIGTLGDSQRWNAHYFDGSLVSEHTRIKIEPYSAMPLSRAATFSEWTELIKTGAAPVQLDDNLNRAMWMDLGKPGMARTRRDMTADVDKAYRNITRVRLGMNVVAEPQDNADAHLAVYTNWMKSAEYERLLEEDMLLKVRMGVLVETFLMVKREEMRLQELQAMMMNPEAAGDFGSPQEARTQGAARAQRPGNNSGGGDVARATQGRGPGATNPNKNRRSPR